MHSIRKQLINFQKTSNYCLSLISLELGDKRKIYIYRTGILNTIWQSWNRFWRTLWLTPLTGGIGITGQILPSNPNIRDEKEAVHYLLYILNKRPTPNGRIKASYQEPRWGTVDTIQDLSQRISNPGNRILGAFSVLGNSPRHLQVVRNAAIHLDNDNMQEVKSIMAYYKITAVKYPTDLMLAEDLRTGKIAVRNWIDELTAFLLLI